MGQVQSDLYECESARDECQLAPDDRGRRLARGKIGATDDAKEHKAAYATKTWRTNQTDGLGGKAGGKKRLRPGSGNSTAGEQQQQHQQQQQRSHIRKLSNVSNRNIQLLSMKPRSEKDTYAEGLRSRRRSSLINLILGAPARGPRFSEDLCSLSSHMSELCNFGIDYFPDSTPLPTQPTIKQNHHHHHHRDATPTTAGRGGPRQASINSSCSSASSWCLSRLDAEADLCRGPAAHFKRGFRGFAPLDENSRRRGSSLGSLTSFETIAVNDGARSDLCPDGAQADDGPIKPIEASVGQEMTHVHAELQNGASPSIQLGGQGRHLQAAVGSDSRRAVLSLQSMILASVDLTSSLDETASDTYKCAAGDDDHHHHHRGAGRYYSNEQVTGPAVKKTPNKSVWAPMETRDAGGTSVGDLPSALDPSGAKTKQRTSPMKVNTAGGQIKTVGRRQVPDMSHGHGPALRGRINHTARRMMIHRSGSELSLYSSASGGSLAHYQAVHSNQASNRRPQIDSLMPRANGRAGTFEGKATHEMDVAKFDNDWSPSATSTSIKAGNSQHSRETKLIIMLQVCLPFILAGFGNMGAGLALNKIAHWEAFRRVPAFFVLLPSFVGLKGNIEMTLASRLSTLSNLNLLDTGYQRRCALLTNLALILGQGIGLSLFAVMASVACEFLIMGKLSLQDHGGPSELVKLTSLVVLPAALVSIMTLVVVSSIVMWFAIWLAKKLQVNPDNLSTLMAALYGDVSCVLTYGLFAQLMYSLNRDGVIVWPVCIIFLALTSWPLLVYIAYQCRETQALALSSMPPMLAAIVVSLGSGAVLSLVVDKFSRVALYQPVVNGFGANLIAVQASRVSTWLWCNALERTLPMRATQPRQLAKQSAKAAGDGLKFEFEPNDKMPYGSLASFTDLTGPRTESEIMADSMVGDPGKHNGGGGFMLAPSLARISRNFLGWCVRCGKLLLWSFVNPSPNSVAARLLLVMLIPAHSLYFVVIWLVAPSQYIHVTWPFYLVYISLCVAQVFVLLAICQPLMTLLMFKHLDPDIFGISLLMALADLIGTICLTGGFYLLAAMGDPNAI